MLKRNLTIAVSAAALMAASSANAFVWYDVEAIQDEKFTGTTFSANLAREYKDFATFEAYKMYDWIDAEHFAEKAIVADAGQSVAPESVEDWDISETHIAELKSARGKLIDAFSKGAKTLAPSEAAEAQAKYDCWMEQQEENHQWAHIAACKTDFYAALDKLSAAMTPKLAAVKTEMPVKQVGTVFFPFDQAALTPTASDRLKTMVESLEDTKNIELRVVGHADRSGPADYNRALSRERAQSVIDGLRSYGMTVADFDELDMEAKGESQPIVITGDGVREPANRRVEIYAEAMKPITVTVPANQSASLSQ